MLRKARVRFVIIEAQKIIKLRKSRTLQTQKYIKNLYLVITIKSWKILVLKN